MTATLYRKYRPQAWKQVLGQEPIISTLQSQLASGRPGQAYLFTGSRGVGKTTVARILAKTLICTGRAAGSDIACDECPACLAVQNQTSLDLIEMDAASQTGVDNVRDNIIHSARLAPALGAYKVFIIDEVHMLSLASFNALLKTLEEPPEKTVFILATTDSHKVPITIQSRCQRFNFALLSPDTIKQKINSILKKEKVKLSDEIITAIALEAQGSERDAESLLQQVISATNPENFLQLSLRPKALILGQACLDQAEEIIKVEVESLRQSGDLKPVILRLVVDYWTQLLIKHSDSKILAALERSFLAERYFKSAQAETVLTWFFYSFIFEGKPSDNKFSDHNSLHTKTVNTSQINQIDIKMQNQTLINQIDNQLSDLNKKSGTSLNSDLKTLEEIENKFDEFYRLAVNRMPSLSLNLSLCAMKLNNQGEIILLTEQDLQRNRLKQNHVWSILQELSQQVWGLKIADIIISPEPITALLIKATHQSKEKNPIETANSFDDVAALLESSTPISATV